MNQPDDFRGHSLQWEYVSGFPLDIRITETNQEVGRLGRKSNLKPSAFGRLASLDLWFDWDEDGLLANHTIGFAGSETRLGEGKTAWNGHYTLVLDGLRTFLLQKVSVSDSSWLSESGECVLSLSRSELSDIDVPHRGSIGISTIIEELDIPPLVLLSVLMAMQQTLFKHDPNRGRTTRNW